MTEKEFDPAHAAAHGYSRDDWNEVSDNPEWTEETFAESMSLEELRPDLAASIRKSRGRPAVDAPRVQISIRLDPDVIAKFRATGKGWQTRINDVLKDAKL